MIRPIVRDTMLLNKKAQPAGKEALSTAKDLLDTLIANFKSCAGLAANMIGVNKRIIAVFAGAVPIVMINPVIVSHSSEKYDAMEGCLSLDGVRPATRYQTIEVDYADMLMKRHRASYSGFTAQAIQHELDHCNGILI